MKRGEPVEALAERVAALRRSFDDSFARPDPTPPPATTPLLALRVCGDPYALALAGLRGLFSAPRWAAVPSRRASLVGIAALRGALTPIFSAAALLGYATPEPPRWVAASRGAEAFGLAFAELEGYLAVPTTELVAATERAGRPGTDGRLVEHRGVARPILSLDALVDLLAKEP